MTRKIRDAIVAKLIRTHRDEGGMVSFVFLIALVLLMVMGGMMYNTGRTVNRKIETQNAADAVAYSGSLWTARGMNAMTAANHVIGELNALYVVHHALGGKYLDEESEENDTTELEPINIWVDTAYEIGKNIAGATIPHADPEQVVKNPKSDKNSAIYEGKRQLKLLMGGFQTAHAIFRGIEVAAQGIPIVGPIIKAAMIALEAAMLVMEVLVIKEYLILTGVEMLAKVTSIPKQAIPVLVTVVSWYQKLLLVGIPIQSLRAADALGERHGAAGLIVGGIPEIPDDVMGIAGSLAQFVPVMPVEQAEKAENNLKNSDGQNSTLEKRSQMLRASYPWVVHWRKNIEDFLKNIIFGAPMSGAGGSYVKWTNRYALQTAIWMRLDSSQTYKHELTVVNHGIAEQSGNGESGKGIQLFIVKGLDQPNNIDKSQEKYHKYGSLSERLTAKIITERQFVHMGFAHKGPVTVGAPAFFRQENPQGFMAFSQSMIYNANPQQEPASPNGGGQPQPEVGWDTLNFLKGGPVVEFPTDTSYGSHPVAKLNWQAKLTPVTGEKMLSAAVPLGIAGAFSDDYKAMWDLYERSKFSLPMTNH